jgi:hypothetical protein
MNRFVLALTTVLAVAVTITVPGELRGQSTRPALANYQATSERTHLTGPLGLPRPDSLPEAEVPCLFTQATKQSQAGMGRWPSLLTRMPQGSSRAPSTLLAPGSASGVGVAYPAVVRLMRMP